jgi:hypothetical protein
VLILIWKYISLLRSCPSVTANLTKEERQQIITPWLRYFARITLWSITKTLLTSAVVLGLVAAATWRFFLAKQWVEDVEYEGNVDAERALEEVDEGEGGAEDKGKGKDGKGKGGKK